MSTTLEQIKSHEEVPNLNGSYCSKINFTFFCQTATKKVKYINDSKLTFQLFNQDMSVLIQFIFYSFSQTFCRIIVLILQSADYLYLTFKCIFLKKN